MRDEEPLPVNYRSNRGGELIQRAQKCGVVVQLLGGERYMLADERGRMILKSATFREAEKYFYDRGVK